MSIPQGSIEYNAGYGDEVVLRVNVAASCPELQRIAQQSLFSLNGTLAAVTDQYNGVVATLTQTEQDAETLANHIAGFAGQEALQTALSTQLATAPAVTADFGSILAYLNAQASIMISVNNGSLAQLALFLLQLNADYTSLQRDITALQAKVGTLTDQLTRIPETITAIENAIATAASRFPNCVIS